jgi:hypothetical protein
MACYSFADWCSIAGVPVGVLGIGYAVRQQWRADREANKRKGLAAESQRFLVDLRPSIDNERVRIAINDQLDRPELKARLMPRSVKASSATAIMCSTNAPMPTPDISGRAPPV